MANFIGKTAEFAAELVNYYINRSDMGAREALYVGLLSAIPSSPNVEPFHASALSAVEVSAGAFRVALPAQADFTVATNTSLSAVRAINDVIIEFSPAPGTVSDTFNVSGYCLVRGEIGVLANDYIGYEFFVASPSKQRLIRGGDTIRINAEGLTILEK